MRRAVVVYAGLLAYGSLYPFHWAPRSEALFGFLLHPGAAYLERGDLVQNVLVYMPFGLLLASWWAERHRYWPGLLLAVAAGTLFSIAAEVAQEWLPARVSSAADVAMNLLGTLVGALLAGLLRRDTLSGARLLAWRDAWFPRGAIANTGLVVLALWLLAQTSPLIPVLSPARWRYSLGPLYYQLHGAMQFSPVVLFCLACNLSALGLLLRALVKPGQRWRVLHGTLLLTVLAAQVLIDEHRLGLEEVLAAALSLIMVVWLGRLAPTRASYCAMALLAAAMVVYELAPGVGGWQAGRFNWVPFRGHMRSLVGFTNILEFLWPFMGMSWLARQASAPARHHVIALGGGALLAAAMLAMETAQLYLPGRSADITQVLLPCAGWAAPWLVEEWVLAHPRA
ncbi:VanZ family protein [Pseudoduganella sp. LjRoot289]|uniref:VanZ family protein n=1 Tax=Pseudoduganella sp. LjRoot289 TaxID=3342314 RepID=UPI003ECC602E